ncbi:MAG: hypothetical protein V4557_14950 [Bacteroidota bacterium]
MKTLVVLLLLVANTIHAQTAGGVLKDNGIYITAKDYSARILTHGFNKRKGIKLLDSKRLFIVIKSIDSSYLYYYDQIWGYRKDGVDWRLFNESGYQVESTGRICIYSLPVCIVCEATQPSYFSVDLTSPIHPLSRNYLISAYHDKTEFVNKIKHLPWTTSIMKRNKNTRNYRFIDWL